MARLVYRSANTMKQRWGGLGNSWDVEKMGTKARQPYASYSYRCEFLGWDARNLRQSIFQTDRRKDILHHRANLFPEALHYVANQLWGGSSGKMATI